MSVHPIRRREPAPSSRARKKFGGPPLPARLLDQFDAGHRGVVPGAIIELDDSRVAAGAVLVARPDLVEQLRGHFPVTQELDYLTVVVNPARFGFGNHLLCDQGAGPSPWPAW